MSSRVHPGTLFAGILLTVVGAVLLTEGLGWWDLDRDGLRFFVPGILILLGVAAIARGLSMRDRIGPAASPPAP